VAGEVGHAGDARLAVTAAPRLLDELGVMDAWVLSTYSGCDIACTYCIVSAQGRSVPHYPASEVADRLRGELDAFDTPPRLGVGAYVDAYPSVEPRHRVTRAALEVLVERDLEFTLVTKGAGVVLDTDLFQAHRRGHLQISLCSLDEDAIRELDPGAPSAAARLGIVEHMVAAGVKVRVQASPWIPGVSDVARLLDLLPSSVPVTVTPLRLPPHLQHTRLGRALTQEEINEAFHREYERVGPRPDVVWSRPPALDGAPPHIDQNIGSSTRQDWTPAPESPSPGPDIGSMRRRARPLRRALLRRYPLPG
jgi:DNA repair photolyase